MTRGTLGITGLVAAATLLAGCGSSAKTLSAPSTPGAAVTSASPLSAPASSPASAAASSSTPASTASAASGGGADANSAFCQIAKAEQAQSAQLATELTSGSTTQLKAFIDKVFAELPTFEAAAPASIKGDVATLVSVDNTLFTSLKADNYDFTKLGPSVTSALADPKFTAAGTHVASYLTTSCGVSATFPTAVATP